MQGRIPGRNLSENLTLLINENIEAGLCAQNLPVYSNCQLPWTPSASRRPEITCRLLGDCAVLCQPACSYIAEWCAS